ncbi:MAG: sodium/glutamate symporter [Xanthomonadales bacterium]|nr:sodium/glutamate symporter [Xanthomonadales bacterium]
MHELILVKPVDTLIIAIGVLALGGFITRRVPPLQRYAIPRAVTGGLIASLVVLLVIRLGGPAIEFDLQLRDIFLLAFFSTIGLNAKISRLKAGGKTLGMLVLLAAVFLVLQDLVGVALTWAMGVHPGYGLMAGSVSFAGGHGTAIAWGTTAEAAGLVNAAGIGVAFATFGLVAGGLIGGPLGEWLVKRHDLAPARRGAPDAMMDEEEDAPALEPVTTRRILGVILVMAVCVSLGDVVNRFLFGAGVKLPGFLTAMMVGIVITNLADARGKPLRQGDYDKVGQVSLQLFLAMSLMSLDLNALAENIAGLLVFLLAQVALMLVFALFVVFRLLGRDYDAAVITSGFAGLGLGATPVAIANMDALTLKHGPSFKAFLVIPLVGAFFIDILNAITIKAFIALPFFQQAPLP